MTLALTVDPKIKTAEDGQKFMVDFVRNPPKSPIEAVKLFANVTGIGGTVTAAIATAFPLVGSVLPLLSGIFSMFGGGGPSIGEVTLTAIQNLGTQINAVAERLENVLTAEIQSSAQKTIDVVLAGQNEIARQQSAVSVFVSTIQADILDAVAVEKNTAYAEFLAATNEAQAQAMDDLKKMLADAQAAVNKVYDSQLAEILNTMYSLIAPFLDALNGFLSDQNQSAAPATRAIAAPAAQVEPPVQIESKSDNINYVFFALAAGAFFLISSKRKKN